MSIVTHMYRISQMVALMALACPLLNAGCVAITTESTEDPNVRVFRSSIRPRRGLRGMLLLREAETKRPIGFISDCRSRDEWPTVWIVCKKWPSVHFYIYPERTCTRPSDYLWHEEPLGSKYRPPADRHVEWEVVDRDDEGSEYPIEPMVWGADLGGHVVIYQIRTGERSETACRSIRYITYREEEDIDALIAEGQERMDEVRRALFEPKRSRRDKHDAD